MKMDVYVDTHQIRWSHLYVMPLVSTFWTRRQWTAVSEKTWNGVRLILTRCHSR